MVWVGGSLVLEHGTHYNQDRKVQMKADAQELTSSHLGLELLLVQVSNLNLKRKQAKQLRRIGPSLQKVVIIFSEFFFL